MEPKNKENIGLQPIIVGYLRQWKVIVLSGVVSLVLALSYLLLYPATYEVMARIQIQEENDLMSGGSIGLGEAAGMMRSFGLGGMASKVGISIDDEIVTLYSSRLMSEMITRLGLYVEYKKPYLFWIKMYGQEPIKVTTDPETLANLEESVKFKISVPKTGKFTVHTKTKTEKHKFQYDSFPAVINLKQGRFVITKNPASHETAFKINTEFLPPSWVAEELAKSINIEDYSNSSNMIEFTYRDNERQRAKDIINTLIALYNKNAFSYKKRIGDSSLDFLDGRIASVTSDLSDVEQKIEFFKMANKLTDAQFDLLYYAESMRELKIKIIELETQTVLIELMNTFVKKPENKYELVPSLFTSSPDTETSPVSEYNKLLLERNRMIKNSGSEDNPVVANLTMQVDRMRESVFQMVDNYHQSMVLARKNLEDKEKQLLRRIDAVPEQERIGRDYLRQQEIYQGVYLILLQKREEIALSIGQDIDKGKLVDAAFAKKKPVHPRKLYAAIAIVLFTFVLSVSWIFLKDIYLSLKEEFKRTA